MPVEIKVPSVGESVIEGTVARWLKRDGDAVRAEEPLLELETEKATTEVAAPAAGTLRIAIPEGRTVPIGSVVGRIEEAPAPAAEKRDGVVSPPRTAAPPKAPLPETARVADSQPTPGGTEPPASPAVRHLAKEKGLDLRQLKGTASGGRITREDVLAHLDRSQAPPAPASEAAPPLKPEAGPQTPPARPEETKTEPARRETRQRMSSIRQRIAERLVASQQATATLTTFNEADLSAVIALRSQFREAFQQKHGVGLGFMSFFVKASVEGLRTYPIVNAGIDGSDIVYHQYYNIGVAVSTERGLMVPVLRDADRLSFAEIEKRLTELAEKARDGKIAVGDLRDGTFTITNGGVFGSLLSTPILNPPQSAILGMHTIQKRPVARVDQIVIRPMMYLALSYDHRLIDGRDAVLFLARVKECIENPERLLLEI
jgi:2-oxoglutarate dehydrogenase E2 component (dihydrolipoamide succinyltransferase)